MKLHLITYAQNREDIILSAFFDEDEKGFYIDIGAYDPNYDSVTKLFYKRGWTGINVEPQPDRYKLFAKRRPKDINVNMGVSNKSGKLILRSYHNQGLSTFSDSMKRDYDQTTNDQTSKYKDIPVQVVTLKQLFNKHKVQAIQFMKIDVEGLEYEVLSGNDWQKYRPEVICIEANHIKKNWRNILTKNDYGLVFFDGLNDYYADKKTKRAAKFDYVESVVFREPIVHFKLLEDFKEYDEAVAWLQLENKRIKAELESTQAHADQLQQTINEITPLRRHIKRFVRYNLGRVDRKINTKLTRKNNFRPRPIAEPPAALDKALGLAHEIDVVNFASFNKAPAQHPLMPAYKLSRKAAVKSVNKARTVRRRQQ